MRWVPRLRGLNCSGPNGCSTTGAFLEEPFWARLNSGFLRIVGLLLCLSVVPATDAAYAGDTVVPSFVPLDLPPTVVAVPTVVPVRIHVAPFLPGVHNRFLVPGVGTRAPSTSWGGRPWGWETTNHLLSKQVFTDKVVQFYNPFNGKRLWWGVATTPTMTGECSCTADGPGQDCAGSGVMYIKWTSVCEALGLDPCAELFTGPTRLGPCYPWPSGELGEGSFHPTPWPGPPQNFGDEYAEDDQMSWFADNGVVLSLVLHQYMPLEYTVQGTPSDPPAACGAYPAPFAPSSTVHGPHFDQSQDEHIDLHSLFSPPSTSSPPASPDP